MTVPSQLYRPSLALLTDFYELTMACAAWKTGAAAKEAAFTLSFRKNPFDGGFTVAAGLEYAVDLVSHLRFEPEDLAFLRLQRGADGAPLFEEGFLEALGRLEVSVDVDAVPEGTVVFPHEPLLRVVGPVIPAMLLESALLAVVNFQTLVATKAARVCHAAAGAEVMEFGLRRAQGPDGGLSAARAACIGGCSGTSNALAGACFALPVKGTHAHSWVQAFGSEREAFRAYAATFPKSSILLVDTYDTLGSGMPNAIAVAREMRAQGHELLGVRIDSGDLAYLSRQARRMLDEAGFEGVKVVVSNDLDEHVIE